jgi:uncharacterized repeat protein (TIGR01451 family)
MNVAVNVGGVSIAGYGGTISLAAGIAATVGATGWAQAGGTFVGGTAAFTLNGPFQLTSGSYTTTAGTTSVSGALTITGGTFSATAGTVSFGGGAATLTVSTPATFKDDLVIHDLVPAALTAGSAIADLGSDCTGSTGNTIHCVLPAGLVPGSTWTVTVPYSVASSVPAQVVGNAGTATSDENPVGVAALDTTAITTLADLAVSGDDGLVTVTAGDGLVHSYTITVGNAGPSDATGVTLSDVWPTGFSLGLVSPSQGSCTPIGGGPDFSCALGTIAAGASATVSVAYTVPAATPGGDQTEIVSVASAIVDPNAADDAAADTTTVLEVAPTPAPIPMPRQVPPTSPGASPSSGVGAAAAPDTDTGGQSQAAPADAGLDLTVLVLSGVLSILVVMLGLFKTVSDRRRG